MKSMNPSETHENIENLCPLDVTELKGRKTDFELYLDIAGKPVLYAEGPYEWSLSEIERLNHDGFSVLFYSKSNDDKVLQLLAQQSMDPVTLLHSDRVQQEQQDRVSLLLQTYRDWVSNVDLAPEQHEMAEEATTLVMETVSQNPTLIELLQALSEHDYYSFHHSMRTAAYGAVISIKLGCQTSQHLHDIILGCLVHDIGHLKVSKETLEKSERLNEREWFEIKQHPLHGMELLREVPLSPVTSEIVLHHHERVDGHGYPHGIKGSELLQEVKIVAFCDVFDALTSPRPYQKPVEFEQALSFIEQNALEYLDKRSFEVMGELIRGQKVKAPA
ncbi:HD-GYP domain-containing protein [Pseudobacteriovorax antillogorgiicola]|uniref:HD-GYP domain, c-di-GMP phosphodiesterase class II (Or its inactivated variant) n=1 Tax=Pseudobacteriovorax antillogorgiicola TaxID=1513793 RepID=A0A1Y6C469_9BACT|nr:HD domain-containing phosphohydrolase [Pseudobacteriovorax antillogorgiicola]TCS50732.1 HD-GYP domain-containing protein (c-di-GMP phosphodiesterase class II) [Pseudobacteriovorax antillogorgiicola]SMF40938.1 HD-GYP domain, c-di-GMP phosphodiesterase class II (or its inactivated variant) [Pseudobacteriovorax antillogorgiicola]